MQVNSAGVRIAKVSCLHATFEAGGVPTTITRADVRRWNEALWDSGGSGLFSTTPIDVTLSSCWVAEQLQACGLDSEAVNQALVSHGASRPGDMWRRATMRVAQVRALQALRLE
jgi:hypothetical protein